MDEKNNNEIFGILPKSDGKKSTKARKWRGPVPKRTVSAIYMGIALCMVLVLAFSVVSTTNKVKSTVDDFGNISINIPDFSVNIPDVSTPATDVGDLSDTDTPVKNEVPGVTDQIISPEDDESSGKKPIPPVPTVNYVRPVNGEVIKGYCMDSLVFSQTMQDFRTHSGVDIAAELGAEVIAYTDGTVSKIEKDPFMGTTVEIVHEAGVTSVYKNLSETLPDGITVGAEVSTGDVIGTVGQSAIVEIADPSHLHFELWMNGELINAEKEISTLKN